MALHVRFIMREMVRRGWNIDLVSTERALRHPAYKIVEEESGGKYQVRTMPDQETPAGAGDFQRVKDQIQRWKNYRAGYQGLPEKPDAVYAVNLDQMDLALALKGSPFGPTPFAGMMIGRHFHCPATGIKMTAFKPRDRALGPVFKKLLKIPTLRKVAVLDPVLQAYVEQRAWRGWEKVAYIPDVASLSPSPSKRSLREDLGIPGTAFVILAYGALSARKGIVELVEGLSDAHCPAEAAVLFAGRQDEFAKEYLAGEKAGKLRKSGRLFEWDAFLDESQERAAFDSADAVWLGYRDWYGMSGVLVQAAAASKPLLAMDLGLVGWLVQKHDIGETVEIFSPASVSNGIRRLLLDGELRKRYASHGVELARNHTPELFGSRISDLIAQTAGQEPAPEREALKI
jgi:glycosyltransferase involved in cell wall biosynthesis